VGFIFDLVVMVSVFIAEYFSTFQDSIVDIKKTEMEYVMPLLQLFVLVIVNLMLYTSLCKPLTTIGCIDRYQKEGSHSGFAFIVMRNLEIMVK